eukprot:TRINITY_DN2083_c0_g1_i2.p3 TRINITY_DN2083_c0_g1~~TRINITY_DN2083_c0_g1_i2.p3  ORF type:complete len:114 (-),score=11.26 TRINITY_DN2083_c0_g1_i2:160-501(-)
MKEQFSKQLKVQPQLTFALELLGLTLEECVIVAEKEDGSELVIVKEFETLQGVIMTRSGIEVRINKEKHFVVSHEQEKKVIYLKNRPQWQPTSLMISNGLIQSPGICSYACYQ